MFYPTYPGQAMRATDPVASASAREAKASARDTRTELEMTKAHVERLMMISEALWMFLKEKHGYTDEDLLRQVQDIDLRDGRLDGRVGPEGPVPCPSCGRNISRKKMLCLYCGAPLDVDLFAR